MAKNVFQQLYYKDLNKIYGKFSGVILDNIIGDIVDLQTYFTDLAKSLNQNTKVLISYHNHLWEPTLTFASKIGFRKKVGIQNWLDDDDLKNILYLSGFDVVSTQKRFFGITSITIAKLRNFNLTTHRKHSVSIIIPARNEEGNISKIISSIPKFGKWQEVIFVEGGSIDNTWHEIIKITNKKVRPSLRIRKAKQRGRGKADATWLGLSMAKGDILMIYDADRTVDAKDLIKFYEALVSYAGDFANGSRLVYPMEKDAMQSINRVGNQIFSWLFTWILGQRFKDTLCGTKAFWKKDYKTFTRSNTDPFGDFDLIFGAIRNNLKVIEIPVRYKERVYGSTNINRFRHGMLLIKMAFLAYKEFRGH